jgi:hypothetical protein
MPLIMQLPRCAKFLFIIDGNRVVSLQKEASFIAVAAADCISLFSLGSSVCALENTQRGTFRTCPFPLCSKEAAPRHVPTRAAAEHIVISRVSCCAGGNFQNRSKPSVVRGKISVRNLASLHARLALLGSRRRGRRQLYVFPSEQSHYSAYSKCKYSVPIKVTNGVGLPPSESHSARTKET